ncbi:AraC family transcriptional regulator [Blastomonas sp.]|uniref:helix-turn-helix domain-containing protein n=1 Tax=Blastomonas sp. TaxID=1909299 RepID=UPI002636550D|nr:AraC family transcriptional regulator [Blastomonas sp.]MDM7956998.1 AraC family transcriptional regulator [Blastomonas sp.]
MASAIIAVSPEMTTLIGPVTVTQHDVPADVTLFAFRPARDEVLPTVSIVSDPDIDSVVQLVSADGVIVFLVANRALARLYDWASGGACDGTYHLSHPLCAIALHIADGSRRGDALVTYRLAKSIELLCETAEALKAGQLVACNGDPGFTERDTRAIVAARDLVDSQWGEKLTLDSISRACGINRAKLTRGFRDIYGCTISEALAERRLVAAQAKLLSTDLPVSSIGYASGYLNNSSFTRAFNRRFGVSPSSFRAMGRAA